MSRSTLKSNLARGREFLKEMGVTPAKVRIEPSGAVEFVLADGTSLTSEAELAAIERSKENWGSAHGRRRN